MANRELDSATLAKVSGGSWEESREIIEFFKSHGYADREFNDEDELRQFLKEVLSITKMNGFYVSNNFSQAEESYNVYVTPDGEEITHEEFMEILRKKFLRAALYIN